MVKGLEAEVGKRIAFYHPMKSNDLERLESGTPGSLHFLAYLEKQGHKVDYFINERALLDSTEQYDVIAISGTQNNLEDYFETSRRIKETNPNSIVTIGGYGTTGLSDRLIAVPTIDAVFEGEGEYTFSLFLRDLEITDIDPSELVLDSSVWYGDQAKLIGVDNVYHPPISKDNAQKIINSTFTRKYDGEEVDVPLNNVMFKDREGNVYANFTPNILGSKTDITPIQGELDELLDLPWWTSYAKHVPGIGFNPDEKAFITWDSTNLYVRRGCNAGCNFCIIDTKTRTPSVDAVVETIEKTISEYAHQTPARKPLMLGFNDDSFSQSKEWAKELMTRLKESGLSAQMGFSMQHRVLDLYRGGELDTETLDLIAENNFTQSIGVESFHPEAVRYLGKSPNGEKYVSRAKEVIRESLRRNIPTNIFLISANPESTFDTIADDYLALSEFGKELYEETGRVFRIKANTKLNANRTSKITNMLTRHKDSQVPASSYSEKARMQLDNVQGVYHPILPAMKEGEFLSIFDPKVYDYDEDLIDFFRNLEGYVYGDGGILGGKKIDFTDDYEYMFFVGQSLEDMAEHAGDESLLKKAKAIKDNTLYVAEDKLGLRRERVVQANKKIDAAVGSPYIRGLNFSAIENNFVARLNGESYEPTTLDPVLDEIISANPRMVEELAKMKDFHGDQYVLFDTLRSAVNTFTKFGYNFEGIEKPDFSKYDCFNSAEDGKALQAVLEATDKQLDQAIYRQLAEARDGMNDLWHELAVSDISAASLELTQKQLKEFPYYAKEAWSLLTKGFPFNMPDGICFVDKDGSMRFA